MNFKYNIILLINIIINNNMEYSIGDIHGDYTKLFAFISHTINKSNINSKLLYNNKIICEYYNNKIIPYIDNFEYNKNITLSINFKILFDDKEYDLSQNNNYYILLGDIFDCFIFTNEEEYKQRKQELSKKVFLFGGPFSYKSYSLKNINQEDLITDNYYKNIKIKYQTLTYLFVKYLKSKLKKQLILILGNHEITYYGLYSKDLRNFITDNFVLYYKSQYSNYIYSHGVANKSILNIINFQLNNKYFHSINKMNNYFNHIINIKNSITLLDKSNNEFNCLTILDYLINYVKYENVNYNQLTLLFNLATNYNILLKLEKEFKNLTVKSTINYLSQITKLFTRTTLFNNHSILLFNEVLEKLFNNDYRIFEDDKLYDNIFTLIKTVNFIKTNFYCYINKIFPSKDIINTKTNKMISQDISKMSIEYIYNNLDNLILKLEYKSMIKKIYNILQNNILNDIHNKLKTIINIYENSINFHLYFQMNIIYFCQYYKIKNPTKSIILEYINKNEIDNIYPLQICGHKYIEKSKINYDKVKIFCMDKSLSSLYTEENTLKETDYLLYYGEMKNNEFTIYNINKLNNINYKLFIEKYNI